jgi:uncharacterized protein (TIGR03000 family)
MYTAVLMLAMTTSAETADFGRRGGCSGGYGCSGCSGYYGGCCGGGYYGGCCGGGGYRSGYYGYYGGGGPNYAYGRYYSSPSYSYGYFSSPNVIVQGQPTNVRQSFYLDPNQAATAAMVRVLVPNPDAEIWFDDTATKQRGTERAFTSPGLDPKSKYKYTVKARWTENGKTVDRQRIVELQPGQPVLVNFRSDSGEQVAPPKKPSPLEEDKKGKDQKKTEKKTEENKDNGK